MNPTDEQLLRSKLNLETAEIPWKELLRYFAGGTVIYVSTELDLVDVAAGIAADDTAAVAQWMSENRVGKVSDDQAKLWLEEDALLWAVVVKPWVLVQEKNRTFH